MINVENCFRRMTELEEYFVPGRCFVFGGWPDSRGRYLRSQGRVPREWFVVEYTPPALPEQHVPLIGNTYKFVGFAPRARRMRSHLHAGEEFIVYTIRLEAENSKIIIDTIIEINANLVNKWTPIESYRRN